MNRWGARKLLIISLIIGLGDWMLTVFDWGGHPTYVALETPARWSPRKAGLLTWQPAWILCLGLLCYGLGSAHQLSQIWLGGV